MSKDWRILFFSAFYIVSIGMMCALIGLPFNEPVVRFVLWLWAISMVAVFIVHYRSEALQAGRKLWSEEISLFLLTFIFFVCWHLGSEAYNGRLLQPQILSETKSILPLLLGETILLWLVELKFQGWRQQSPTKLSRTIDTTTKL
jgi:hypothetical protein